MIMTANFLYNVLLISFMHATVKMVAKHPKDLTLYPEVGDKYVKANHI